MQCLGGAPRPGPTGPQLALNHTEKKRGQFHLFWSTPAPAIGNPGSPAPAVTKQVHHTPRLQPTPAHLPQLVLIWALLMMLPQTTSNKP